MPMIHQKVQLSKKQADGYITPLGTVNMVNAMTDVGMVCCGVFDVGAMEGFGYPAVKVKGSSGPIANVDDLLKANVIEANPSAEKLGVKVGITGRDALELL
jgi:uncharacterized protein YunC (DUF1805 family)